MVIDGYGLYEKQVLKMCNLCKCIFLTLSSICLNVSSDHNHSFLRLIEYYNRATWESGVASMMQNSKWIFLLNVTGCNWMWDAYKHCMKPYKPLCAVSDWFVFFCIAGWVAVWPRPLYSRMRMVLPEHNTKLINTTRSRWLFIYTPKT